MLVSDYLHKGAENPQTAKELCDLLHLDKRALTAAIERERRQGSPICASCSTETPRLFPCRHKRRNAEVLRQPAPQGSGDIQDPASLLEYA